jgi:hypothetical protein
MNHVAIFIDAHGEITTPPFDGLADPDHPGGPLWNIRHVIDSADPHGIDLPETDGLVAWIDGHAFAKRRSANVVASLLLEDLLCAPLAVVCGPLMITGGTRHHPRALTAEQAEKALARFDIELDTEPAEG